MYYFDFPVTVRPGQAYPSKMPLMNSLFESWIQCKAGLWNFHQLSFPEFDVMSFKKFYSFKDFQSDQIQRSSHWNIHCSLHMQAADLNLTLVTGTTNRFIFQIINWLIEFQGYTWTALTVNVVIKTIFYPLHELFWIPQHPLNVCSVRSNCWAISYRLF